MMKRLFCCSLLCLGLLGTTSAEPAKFLPNFSGDSFSASASVGLLYGTAHEKSYAPSRTPGKDKTLSRLDWKIKHLPILKLDLAWDAYSFLTLNARGWFSLKRGNGHMDDYDWLDEGEYEGLCPTCTGPQFLHSWHPDTDVNYAYEFDLNLKGWILQGANYRFGPMLGYQQSRFKWSVYGGHISYWNGTLERDVEPKKGCVYKQRFSAPYIGLAGQLRWKKFELNANFKFSDWVRARDTDNHIERQMIFNTSADDMRYYGFSVDAGYQVTQKLKIFTEFSYNNYQVTKGDVFVHGEEGTGDIPNGGGMSNRNYAISLGLRYSF